MSAAPPKVPRRENKLPALVFAAAGIGVGAFVFFFNPATHHFYPVCQFHKFTGLDCPGCGGTRALYALLHGDFLTALHDNAFFVALVFLFTVRAGWFAVKRIQGRPEGDFFPQKLLWPLLMAALVFGVLRNLPWFSILSPD